MFALYLRIAALLSVAVFSSFSAHSAEIRLNDWAFNINGDVFEYYGGDVMPGEGSLDPGTGLGTLEFEFNAAGHHSFIAFLDLEFDAAHNTFFNESGAAHGAPEAGQSWQIDEPGLLFGNIYDNVLAGALNNENTVPALTPDDVSFALGWNFVLTEGESAYLSLFVSEFAPEAGFYLSHTDPEMGAAFDQQQSVYFWSTLEIFGSGVSVTESSAGVLLAIGLGLLVRRRKYSCS